MEKITKKRAIELLNQGFSVKCKVSRGVYEPIKSLGDLAYYERLSTQQGFELYEDKPSSVSIPKDAMEITIDDAFELLADFQLLYCIRNGETEEISTSNELRGVIRSCNIRGEKFVLYWEV